MLLALMLQSLITVAETENGKEPPAGPGGAAGWRGSDVGSVVQQCVAPGEALGVGAGWRTGQRCRQIGIQRHVLRGSAVQQHAQKSQIEVDTHWTGWRGSGRADDLSVRAVGIEAVLQVVGAIRKQPRVRAAGAADTQARSDASAVRQSLEKTDCAADTDGARRRGGQPRDGTYISEVLCARGGDAACEGDRCAIAARGRKVEFCGAGVLTRCNLEMVVQGRVLDEDLTIVANHELLLGFDVGHHGSRQDELAGCVA